MRCLDSKNKQAIANPDVGNTKFAICHSSTTSETHHLHSYINLLSSGLEGVREAAHVVLERAVVLEELNVGTIDLNATLGTLLEVFVAVERGEAPVLRDDDLLPTGELVLGATKGFDGSGTVGVTGPDGEEDLADVHTGDRAVRLAPRTTHTGLETIGSGARQHLVDADDVVRVSAHAQMETFLSSDLDKILVGADTGGFQSLGAQLFILVRYQVHTERELVHARTLTAQVEDTDLRVGHTAVEPGLGVRLVLAVAVASRGTTGHLDGIVFDDDTVVGVS